MDRRDIDRPPVDPGDIERLVEDGLAT